MIIIALLIIVFITIYFFNFYNKKEAWTEPTTLFPMKWRILLEKNVNFYNSLSIDEKKYFEFEIQEFLANHKITGIDVNVDITDKLLVASSAVIPIFKFPDWKYTNLDEVLIYSDSFNENFETKGENRKILGMVGTGFMNGTMILSKPALHHGFSNQSDKKNTAIHEFIHLIDKMDGVIDGIPKVLLENQYSIPWFDLIDKKIDEIYKKRSDINPYGGTSRVEFFAVIGEYFFERPKLLSRKHPELYEILEQIFNQSMKNKNLVKKTISIGRNSPCPCSSGLKYKKCCAVIN
ncbi:zinc-dependent peptidase [Urechidicola croceus]|uniref:Peptidase n=1 Tax=Urechidicola croceus TaxID=1850246 RepID=A0A1D8P6W3_9FLAO|nr:zinc-dependent peptidase [Urechidicola croceus]AOW20308.1 peptidase [Urechidicola croceus]